MNEFKIPLHKPFWGKEEEAAAIEAMRGGIGVGDLSFGQLLSREISKMTGAKHVLPISSGTGALELACACVLKDGDEVILPSFTFPSCANAILLMGAKPVFCDIDVNSYNIDPKQIIKKVTKKTRAIMVVHYAGFACDMDAISKIAKEHNLAVIEDAAHCLGAYYKGKHLGTIGDMGCFSFHGTKNIASGEGGAFVTNNSTYCQTAEIIREKGTDRSAFMRGEKKKYSWVGIGRSLVFSDILAAVAFEQMKKLPRITKMRKKNAKYLLSRLSDLSTKIVLPKPTDGSDGNWHIFAIRVGRGKRGDIITGLRKAGIESSFHYLPLHNSPMGKKLGYKDGDFPVTEEVAATLFRLPMYPSLTYGEMDYIAKTLEKLV